jgi:hypothetical protein
MFIISPSLTLHDLWPDLPLNLHIMSTTRNTQQSPHSALNILLDVALLVLDHASTVHSTYTTRVQVDCGEV